MPLDLKAEGLRLAERLLEENCIEIQSRREDGAYLESPHLVDTAQISEMLGFPRLLQRILPMLPANARLLSDEALTEKYPEYPTERIAGEMEIWASESEAWRLCCQGKYSEAFALAKSDRDIQNMIAVQIIHRRFDDALNSIDQYLREDFRKETTLSVMVIELFRSNRLSDAQAILTRLEHKGLRLSERIGFALGFTGRDPWPFMYPFVDW